MGAEACLGDLHLFDFTVLNWTLVTTTNSNPPSPRYRLFIQRYSKTSVSLLDLTLQCALDLTLEGTFDLTLQVTLDLALQGSFELTVTLQGTFDLTLQVTFDLTLQGSFELTVTLQGTFDLTLQGIIDRPTRCCVSSTWGGTVCCSDVVRMRENMID